MGKLLKAKICLVFICLFLVVSLPKATLAYYSGARWPSTFRVGYSIDPQLDSKLHITGTTTRIDSAGSKWTKASNFVFYSTTYANGVPISAKDFSVADPCNPLVGPSTDYARVCPVRIVNNGNDIEALSMFFNNASRVTWNTSGTLNCGSTPRQMDFSTVALHEFGHLFLLKDYPTDAPNFDAVMAANCTKKLNLLEDDFGGATQMYGPKTGWESGYAQGEVSNILLNRNTIAHGGSGLPELRPRSAEFSVPVKTGSKYELIAVNAQDLYSSVVFKLFTQDNEGSASRNYFKITRGMYLE